MKDDLDYIQDMHRALMGEEIRSTHVAFNQPYTFINGEKAEEGDTGLLRGDHIQMDDMAKFKESSHGWHFVLKTCVNKIVE